MNLPVFSKVLGKSKLYEADIGSDVLSILNDTIDDGCPPFSYEMTGIDIYNHYLSLPPSSRLKLESLELMSKQEWIAFSRQADILDTKRTYKDQNHNIKVMSAYCLIVILCGIIALAIFSGYMTNLLLHNDSPDSYILNIVYSIFEFYEGGQI